MEQVVPEIFVMTACSLKILNTQEGQLYLSLLGDLQEIICLPEKRDRCFWPFTWLGMDVIVKLGRASCDHEEKAKGPTEILITVLPLSNERTAIQYFISFDPHNNPKTGKENLILPILQIT